MAAEEQTLSPQPQQPLEKPKPFSGARKNWRFVLKFLIFSFLFWLAEFAYQFYSLIPGELGLSLVRSFALSGATFFGLALFSSAIFKWKPKYAKYWYVRRSLGVMGFVFIVLHVSSVIQFIYQGNPALIYWSLNPLENPIIFGVLALPIFFLMAVTSFDWAVERLGYKRWKTLHRLAYFGYILAVSHFIAINPPLLMNPAGYLLLGVTVLALAGELYWFIRTVKNKRSSTKGIIVGIILILLWFVFLFFALGHFFWR